MFLLIDECCGKSLVVVAQQFGHSAQRSIEVQALGRGASDAEIVEFARRHGAVIVTNNSADFLAAAAGIDHPGMILLPNVVGKTAARLFRHVLPIAGRIVAERRGAFVSVDEQGEVETFILP